MVGQKLAMMAVSLALGALIRKATQRDDDSPIVHPKPATLASRGAQIPLLIGRDRLAPVFLFEWNRTREVERATVGGGKGVLGSGSGGLDREVFFANAVHALCIGPARRLHSIKNNGERIWPIGDEYPNGITPETHPSGSLLNTENPTGPFPGSFRIFWGESNQPFNPAITGASAFPVRTRFPFICYIQWGKYRLGGPGQWGDLEYDMECAPYVRSNTFGTNYYDLPPTLPGSVAWLRNGLSTSEGDTVDALLYNAGSNGNGNVLVQGDVTDAFNPAQDFIIRDSGTVDGRYTVAYANYDPNRVVSRPTSDYDIRVADATNGNEVREHNNGGQNLVTDIPNANIPGYSTGPLDYAFAFAVNTRHGGSVLDFSNANWGFTGPRANGYVPPGTTLATKAGSGYHQITLVLRNLASEPGYGFDYYQRFAITTGMPPGVGAIVLELFLTRNGAIQVTFAQNLSGVTYGIREIGNKWFKVVIAFWTGPTRLIKEDDDLFVAFSCGYVKLGGSPWSGQARFLQALWGIAAGDTALAGDPLFQFAEALNFQGITEIGFSGNLTQAVDYQGTLTPLISDLQGEHGANAAHIVYQVLIQDAPHGIGLDGKKLDRDSFIQAGIDCEIEGLRCHFKVDNNVSVSQRLSELMLDVGLDFYWDATTGRYGLKLVRPGARDASVQQNIGDGPPAKRIRRLDSDPVKRIVYTCPVAADGYREGSVEIDERGNSAFQDLSNVERDLIHSARDLETLNRMGRRRALLEFSRPSGFEVSLSRQGKILRSSDLIDVSTITGVVGDTRVIEVESEPKSTSAKVSAYNEQNAYLDDGANRQFFSNNGGGSDAGDDAGALVLRGGDGSLNVLRIPRDEDALFAVVVGSEDGDSYWGLGNAPGTAGGFIASKSNFVFRAPVDKWTRGLRQFPVPGMLRGRFQSGEEFSFDSLTDMGDGLWRINGALGVTPPYGELVYLYERDNLEAITRFVPSEGSSPTYKVVPATRNSVGDFSTATPIPEVPESDPGTPAGGGGTPAGEEGSP